MQAQVEALYNLSILYDIYEKRVVFNIHKHFGPFFQRGCSYTVLFKKLGVVVFTKTPSKNTNSVWGGGGRGLTFSQYAKSILIVQETDLL
jgi:hypothetical protein